MVQGNQSCGNCVSAGVAIALLITGKVFFFIGLSCLIAGTSMDCNYDWWDDTYYYDPVCDNLTIAGSVIMVIGIIMIIAGASFYCMRRRNPVRLPPVNMTYPSQVVTVYPQAYPNATGSYPSASAVPGTTTAYPAAIPGITTAYPTTGYQTPTNYPPNNDYPAPPPYSAYPGQPGQMASVPYPQGGTPGFSNEQHIPNVHGYPQKPGV